MRHTGTLVAQLALLTVALVAGLFWLEGRLDMNMCDEGYLWYGVQRVMAGEVPLRDFMAYDPGRYYVSAALMRLWGDNGLLSLRLSAALVQALGLFVGLWCIARSGTRRSLPYLLLSAVTLVAWMQCYWIMYNLTVSILLIAALAWLVAKPSGARYLGTGVMVGLAAIIGRNHGVYGVAGSLCALVWLNAKPGIGSAWIKNVFLWGCGVVLGYLPLLAMCVFVPGFFDAFLESIQMLLEMQGTNIPLPWPWPWTVNFGAYSPDMAVRKVLIALFFMATAVFAAGSLLWLVRCRLKGRPVSPAFVGAACLGLPYAHYAYSRADIIHLAHGVFPLLIGCLSALAPRTGTRKWLPALVLCAASAYVMAGEYRFVYYDRAKGWTDIEIGGDRLVVEDKTAREVAILRELVAKYVPAGKQFITMPMWPGAYSVLGMRAPIWEIYGLIPHSRAFEQKHIDRLEPDKIGLILLYDKALDGHEAMRFRNTHPLTYRYIQEHFARLPESPDPHYELYVPRDRTSPAAPGS